MSGSRAVGVDQVGQDAAVALPVQGLRLLALGHAVREGHLQVAVLAREDDGGLHLAPPVLVFRVEDPQVDERGQLRRVARRGEFQQLPRPGDGPPDPFPSPRPSWSCAAFEAAL
ncbi:hypothetical protein ACIPRL_34710 [Streptomyces sp. NPDC090085]|uniref:hypothetical protein n=1 Tax=Streptomyces sp. NPDC090085 TaxID=3365943 RepID=UPI0038066007